MTRARHLRAVPPAAAADDLTRTLRFAFSPDINAEAQAVLARFFDAFAGSLDGVSRCRTRFDPRRNEWVAMLDGPGARRLRLDDDPAGERHQQERP